MSWVQEIHQKASVIHQQIAGMSAYAAANGLDVSAVCAPFYELLDDIYGNDLPFARLMDTSDIVIRAQGRCVESSTPSVHALESLLGNLRNEVTRITKTVIGLAPRSRLMALNDFPLQLSGLARGSLVVGLMIAKRENVSNQTSTLPTIEEPIFDAVRTAVRSISLIPHYLTDEGVSDELSEAFPDPGIRDAALVAAQRLAPTKRSGIEKVSVLDPHSQRETTGLRDLTANDRQNLKVLLRNPVSAKKSHYGEFVGIVRELDLDANRFEIRGVQDYGAIRCVIPELGYDHGKAILNTWIRVYGMYEASPEGKPRLLKVDRITTEPIPQNSDLFE